MPAMFAKNLNATSPQRLEKLLFCYSIFAIISLYCTIYLPYIGEEGVYTISAMEMAYSHHYLTSTLFGSFYGRPPLMSWLIIPLTKLLGWQHVLGISRFISASATSLTALITFTFVKRLSKNALLAHLCTAIYLSGNLLFMNGWLSYADPLLSLFVFASIALLWIGVEEKRNLPFLFAASFIGLGFLTKALTPYIFYGLAGIALFISHKNRWFLLRPTSIFIHLFALTLPFIWFHFADQQYQASMFGAFHKKAFEVSFHQYLYQIFFYNPVMLILRLAPISFVALYYFLRRKKHNLQHHFKDIGIAAFWIAFLNFALCWFSNRWPEARYYQPVYPVMALVMAYVIFNAPQKAKQLSVYLLAITLFLKFLAVVTYFPFVQYKLRPLYPPVADIITDIVKDKPLYVTQRSGQTSPVEGIVSTLDSQRLAQGKAPILYPPSSHWTNAYIIGQHPPVHYLVKFPMHHRTCYLWCRGDACRG